MQSYYIFRNYQKEGPFSLEDLRGQQLPDNTLVWRSGMQHWMPAADVAELTDIFIPARGKQLRKIFTVSGYILTGILLITCSVLFYYQYAALSDHKRQLTEDEHNKTLLERNKQYTRDHIDELVRVSHSGYRVRAVGGISELTVLLNNSTDYPIDMITVEVRYIKDNGEVFKTENLHFMDIKAHSEVSQYAPESGSGKNVECSIGLLKSDAIGL